MLAFICFFTCCAGIIYQLIDEMHLNQNSVLTGLPLGLAFGFLELFLFPKSGKMFRQWSFTKLLLFKTVLYTAIIYFISIALTIIAGLIEGHKWKELPAQLLSIERFILIVYTLVIYGMLLFFLQINNLLGEGVLWKFISGRYHRPREEERIFMFLDMKSSTTIAENLGHVKYFEMLKEYYADLSGPIINYHGEIYQYVGDEIVVTWTLKIGLHNNNCIQCFLAMKAAIMKQKEKYNERFGLLPGFKAGFHVGKVTTGEIGVIKKEIIFTGDVLNATARIQGLCNSYHVDILISGDLKKYLDCNSQFQIKTLGETELRGRGEKMELFTIVSS